METRGHLSYQSSSSTLSETKSGVFPVDTGVAGFHVPEDLPVSTSRLPEGVLGYSHALLLVPALCGLWGAGLGFSHLHDLPLLCWTIFLSCDDFTLLTF